MVKEGCWGDRIVLEDVVVEFYLVFFVDCFQQLVAQEVDSHVGNFDSSFVTDTLSDDGLFFIVCRSYGEDWKDALRCWDHPCLATSFDGVPDWCCTFALVAMVLVVEW